MPKTEIDYSNTIFYKIYCKDESINELYIGHTTNFVQRKHAHKNSCNNVKSPCYPLKVYKTIRENGGWNNWTMDIIAFHNCKDSYEARKTEQEYYDKLGATLNSIQPLPPRKLVNVVTVQEQTNPKVFDGTSFKYRCEKCDYNCIKKYDYERHISTKKHNRAPMKPNTGNPNYICDCGNVYKHPSGLYRHRKSCNNDTEDKESNTNIDKYEMLMLTFMKENQEFKQLLIDQNTKIMELMCKLNNK
jgi:hypothetical protein